MCWWWHAGVCSDGCAALGDTENFIINSCFRASGNDLCMFCVCVEVRMVARGGEYHGRAKVNVIGLLIQRNRSSYRFSFLIFTSIFLFLKVKRVSLVLQI